MNVELWAGGRSTGVEKAKRHQKPCCIFNPLFSKSILNLVTMTMDVDAPEEVSAPLPTLSLNVLHIVQTAQGLHGLKHSEYLRYRYDHIIESGALS